MEVLGLSPDITRKALYAVYKDKCQYCGAKCEGKGEMDHIIPKSNGGKIFLGCLFVGLILFLSGVFMGSQGLEYASLVAVLGMVIYFFSGLIRLRFD